MTFTLTPLPFAPNALEPYMSAQTFEFHHGKHHQTYVNTLNGLIEGTPFANLSLEEIILEAAKDPARVPLFNNAAQTWNHDFFWNSLSPSGGGKPDGILAQRIDATFGNLDTFKEQFKQAALGQFGSGWVWLVADGDQMKIVKTANAVNPLVDGLKPLITCDVWEHAYYIDYQNRRGDMVQAFLDHIINWKFAEKNLGL